MTLPSLAPLLETAWFGATIVLLAGVGGGITLGRASQAAFAYAARRNASLLVDGLLQPLVAPMSVGWAVIAAYIAALVTDMWGPHRDAALRIGLLMVVAWGLIRSADVVFRRIAGSLHTGGRSELASVMPLAGRISKIVLVVGAGVMVLSSLGYPVTSLLAGLGIGGLALALAAQKTAENVFGSVSIGIDQPFRVGELVQVDGILGTVELLGLRSTRIRTLDRTLVTIPNGRLADMKVENLAARDRMRLSCTLGLEYGTTRDQLRTVLEGVRGVLREHPLIWPDTILVRFKELGASSLDIEVMAWFRVTDWGEFLEVREEVLMSFMGVVEEAGCSFAFPTQTLHLRTEAPSA